MSRPVGLAAGALGLVVAWLGGIAIAQLTGATPVLILVAAGLVLALASFPSGWLTLRRVRVGEITLPPRSNQGEEFLVAAELETPRPIWIEIRADQVVVATGWAADGRFRGTGSFRARGAIDELELRLRSAGSLGLVWWRRRVPVPIDRHLVAPPARDGGVPFDRARSGVEGERAGSAGAIAGEIDGVRPWREGDSEKWVHWGSTLRSGELIVHDRRHASDDRWVVRARPGRPDPDAEAGAVRWTLERGLRSGAAVGVAIGDGDVVEITDGDAAARWSALADLGEQPVVRRSLLSRRWRTEPEPTARLSARWWSAGATLVSLVMLTGALGYGLPVTLLVAVGVFGGAAASGRSLRTGEPIAGWIRSLVGVGALLSLGMVLAGSGRIDGLLSVLRGPLPQLLIVLIVLHGFESRDRRTIRVGLGISATVLMYASGFRVDDTVGWWMLAWAACFGLSLSALSGPTEHTTGSTPIRRSTWSIPDGVFARGSGRRGARFASVGAGAVVTGAVLAVVPVPDGPARLTLPTFIENVQDITTPGAIVGPGGSVRSPGNEGGDGNRAPIGQAGGYTGFAQSMDTSVRGELGDEIVMRVRAPEPDFWRGQTFGRFDGRRWYADDEIGLSLAGPNIDIPDALGATGVPNDVDIERFIQTFFVEADMPNVVFHAYRPVQVILDADVWARQDGAIRASTVLDAGSIYTVVSARAKIDEHVLRRQGHIGPQLTSLGREVFAQYLEVPASTTPETIALATELAEGKASSYDIVRSYEAWLGRNIEYDLDAPLPSPNEDAVHDFLFDTRLGFCEQIASALTVMLRTQGVPARLATGFVAGERNRITGVFDVRASDAHAWVEVWFPETGWQAFDPTAAVPLSADAGIDSVGADLAAGLGGYVGDHPMLVGALAVLGLGGVAAAKLVGDLGHRRRRGRWGILQDRFAAAATRRGAREGAPNPRLASAWVHDDAAEVAGVIAERLDRVAFDPAFTDDDRLYDETRQLVGSLPGPDR